MSARILVVDDIEANVRLLQAKLTAEYYAVFTAADGASALKAAVDTRPDVILLDIGLPGMSGYEVAARIRQERRLDQTLLVALTGWGSEADKRAASEAGFDVHLTKPVGPDALMEVLAAVKPREAA